MDTSLHRFMNMTLNLYVSLYICLYMARSADFTNMNILDADDTPLKSSRGEVMQRDIVQFVEFRKYQNAPPCLLAKETLAEVPGQVSQCYVWC